MLFSLRIAHGYYGAAEPDDFEFLWSSDSQQLLRNGKLLARIRNGVLHCLYECNADGSPRTTLAGQQLSLGLKLRNPWFANVTALDLPAVGSCPLYRNNTTPGSFDPPLTTIPVARLISHRPVLAERPLTASLRNDADQAVFSQQLDNDSDAAVTIPLNLLAPGSYRLHEQTGTGNRDTHYLLQPDLAAAGIFACCEIRVDVAFYTSPAAFLIEFAPRTEQLSYYVVAQNYSETEFAQLAVSDTGHLEQARPQIDFTRVDAAAFGADDIDPAILGAPAKRVVLFRSQSPVSRQRDARRNIQLSRNGEVLIANLPAPGADKPQADFIIHVAKP